MVDDDEVVRPFPGYLNIVVPSKLKILYLYYVTYSQKNIEFCGALWCDSPSSSSGVKTFHGTSSSTVDW